jgi:hypothetical protein
VRVAWLAASTAALWTLRSGNIYVALGLLAALAWGDARQGRLARAGIWLALLAALKPQFGLCLVLLAVAAGWRHWRVWLPAAGVTVAAWGLPMLVYGPQVIGAWLAAARVPAPTVGGNGALPPLLTASDAPLTFLLVGLGALAVLLWAARTRPAPATAVEAGLLAAVLLGPISWPGYGLLVLPVYLGAAWHRRWWPGLVLLSVPGVAALTWLSLALLGPLTLAGRLALLGAWLMDRHLSPPSRSAPAARSAAPPRSRLTPRSPAA